MRAFALLLILLQATPSGLAELCARPAHGTAECEDEQPPAGPVHQDHEPGAPCEACEGLPCPSQRTCARSAPALAAGGFPGEVARMSGAVAAPVLPVLPAAPATGLFHPPRV
jgi:hypothetical protein